MLVTFATFVSGLKRKHGSSLTTGLRAAELRAGRMGMIELYSVLLSIGTTTTLTLLHRAQDTVDGELFLTDEINVLV